jgi:TonB family protein
VVNKKGTVKGITVVRSSTFKELDNEAVRVVSSMPKWIPGEQKGEKVAVYFMLPVSFRLE